jgi:DUF4097 and DUF4098 domain-containing protein YvlB
MKKAFVLLALSAAMLFWALTGCSFNSMKSTCNETITEEVNSQKAISVNNPIGNVQFAPADQGEIQITAIKSTSAIGSEKKLSDIYKQIHVEVSKTEDTVSINVKYSKSLGDVWKHLGVDLNIEIPSTINVIESSSSSSAMSAEKLSGLEKLSFSSDSGNLILRNCSAKEVSIKIDSGNVNFSNIRGNVNINTLSSNIKLDNLEGILDYTADSSNLEVMNSSLMSGTKIYSDSGPVAIDLKKIEATGAYRITTKSGNILLSLPENSGFQLDAKSVNIKDDYNTNLETNPQSICTLAGVVGKGGPDISIYSSSGTITLSKTVQTTK